MLKRLLFLAGLMSACASFARAQAIDIANLREDVRGLTQRVGELSLRVEQLETENASLRNKANSTEPKAVTVAQLNEAVAELHQAIQSAVATAKADTLQQVAVQMEKLAKETNAALDSLAKNQASRPSVATSFSGDFPKEGTNYTIQKGDTIDLIAKKTGAKAKDIINANKIADPSRILVGQTLFIPGGK